ncbi:hypothetical protein [Sulfuriflexus mobilis]|uniref:hypothetical protein n=1 Tax=Sulfuriflexus mobilis TaxID=1811807 RepID=UPI000F81EAAF|nr:hypothetical protein [Sulfuriflexus mobilis]
MKYKELLIIIPLLVLSMGTSPILAQEEPPEEEEEPIQARPVPYTRPDPTSREAVGTQQQKLQQQKLQQQKLQQQKLQQQKLQQQR